MKRAFSFASTRPRRAIGMVVATMLLASVAIGTACSNQGEGERCDSNEDCQSGLVCTPHTQLPQDPAGQDRCCPVNLSSSTSSRCKGGAAGTDASEEPVPTEDGGDASSDGATDDAGETDSGADASDSGSDGGDASDQ